MLGTLLLTLRELTARKITLGLFLVSTLVWSVLAFALNLDIVDGTLSGIRIFGQQAGPEGEGGSLPLLEELVVGVEQAVAGAGYWMGILLALFATAPLVVALQERGRIDLLLSKPVSRSTLLAGHLLGVLMTVLMLAVYLLGMIWLVMSIKSGIWNAWFLTSIGMAMIMFTIMYGVVLLLGVTSQSTALSLIATYGLIFCSIVFVFKTELVPQINPPWRQIFLALYYILPNFAEVTKPAVQLAAGQDVGTWKPLYWSAAFGLAAYAMAFRVFSKRDY